MCTRMTMVELLKQTQSSTSVPRILFEASYPSMATQRDVWLVGMFTVLSVT